MSGRAFQLPLDLPHAATVAGRIVGLLDQDGADPARRAASCAEQLAVLLAPFRVLGENPPEPEAAAGTAEALSLARELVDAIEEEGLRSDRLGQRVRNLFECLARGAEGALISLRAGEDPASPQRP